MVSQDESLETSSRRKAQDGYEVRCLLRLGPRPSATELHSGHVIGVFGTDPIDIASLKEPPHIALANLPEDDKALQGFVNRWGPFTSSSGSYQSLIGTSRTAEERVKAVQESLRADSFLQTHPEIIEAFIKAHPEAEAQGVFTESPLVLDFRDLLRKAWKGDAGAQFSMREEVGRHMKSTWSFRDGRVEMIPDKIWSAICILFLRDYEAGRTGVCANPDCPAPYYLKSRGSQKFCEAGPCVAYAQRQYALRWWNKAGKARRAKMQKKNRKSRRKAR